MGVCTAFVFAALVEFTFVNYLWRKTAAKSYLDDNSSHRYNSRTSMHNDEYGMENGGRKRPDNIVELNMVSIKFHLKSSYATLWNF